MQQAAELSVAAPTIEAALDGRFLSGLKEERVAAAEVFAGLGAKAPSAVQVWHSSVSKTSQSRNTVTLPNEAVAGEGRGVVLNQKMTLLCTTVPFLQVAKAIASVYISTPTLPNCEFIRQ